MSPGLLFGGRKAPPPRGNLAKATPHKRRSQVCAFFEHARLALAFPSVVDWNPCVGWRLK